MDEGHNPRDEPPSSEGGESGLDAMTDRDEADRDEADRDEADRDDRQDPADRPDAGATVVPDLTADELEVGWGERPRESGWSTDSDEWLLRERPPHWE